MYVHIDTCIRTLYMSIYIYRESDIYIYMYGIDNTTNTLVYFYTWNPCMYLGHWAVSRNPSSPQILSSSVLISLWMSQLLPYGTRSSHGRQRSRSHELPSYGLLGDLISFLEMPQIYCSNTYHWAVNHCKSCMIANTQGATKEIPPLLFHGAMNHSLIS